MNMCVYVWGIEIAITWNRAQTGMFSTEKSFFELELMFLINTPDTLNPKDVKFCICYDYKIKNSIQSIIYVKRYDTRFCVSRLVLCNNISQLFKCWKASFVTTIAKLN